MSITNIFGIPFRITCCGEAASQFYNPLQESTSSDLRATIGGGDPANVARNFFKKTNKTKEDEKKKVEAKKKVATTTTKTSQNQGTGGDLFKFPKRKFFAVTAVGKEELPEGVASMTKRDTIVIEGGKRYKKIIINKVMLDGTKKTEEIKQCLD